MNDLGLLEFWRRPVTNAVTEVWKGLNYQARWILTESDLKCWVYTKLFNESLQIGFAVHTEVTHWHHIPVEGEDPEKVYHFRDLSLLNPDKINENADIWNDYNYPPEYILTKGFNHRGPATHIELKLVRQEVTENRTPKVSVSDIDNLRYYSRDQYDKRFAIIWGARPRSLNVDALETKFIAAFNGADKKGTLVPNQNKMLVDAYVFDDQQLKHGRWTGNAFEFVDITPNPNA